MNVLEARRRLLDGEIKKRTAEGEDISVRSVARMRPGLTLYGKSEQKTTTGAQLLDTNNMIDGYYDTNGNVINNELSVSIPKVSVREFNSITVSGLTNNIIWLIVEQGNDGTVIKKTIELSNQYLLFSEDTSEIGISFYKADDSKVTSDMLTTVMVNFGTTPLTWEPYTGGAPSPSPDYPQEIKSVGDSGEIAVNVYGGNLITDTTDKTISGKTGDAANTVRGTWRFVLDKNILNDEVAFSFDSDSNVDDIFIAQINATVSGIINWSDNEKKTIIKGRNSFIIPKLFDELPEGNVTYCAIQMRIEKNPTHDLQFTVSNPMMNIGSTALSYEPYRTPQTIPVQTPNGLPGIPVDSGGNYTDESGQQWMCDEVDFKRGVYVHRIHRDDLKTCVWSDTWDEVFYIEGTFIVFTLKFNDTNSGKYCKCSHFTYLNNDILSNPDTGMQTGQDNKFNIAFRVPTTLASNIEEWEYFIQQNDIDFMYVLNTPVETPLSPSELAAYAALRTYSPTTIVSNDSGAWMKLGYKTKKSLEVTD
ncbi:MAG TPA: hypothetical protein H9717_02175 [Candidatus Eisenbergiella merdipullorum]|uniref:Uncharacterized protein n=1 Tax=Candidatus Eisenbergiella merdipullorum TaxID=2838553 RepID=A0A9D2KZZ5_9FIRM|nr:hypothetical protein [Candidatus Eisenbergiella merdipullorum]